MATASMRGVKPRIGLHRSNTPATVGLAAVVTGNTAVTDPLAMVLLYLRIGQSVVHLISTAVPLILVRATLFLGQLVIVLYWSYGLLTS